MKIEGLGAEISARTRLAGAGDQLETAFLAEMLKITMPDGGTGSFGGGAGESQFFSFRIEQHAAALAARLDLGLAAGMGADHG